MPQRLSTSGPAPHASALGASSESSETPHPYALCKTMSSTCTLFLMLPPILKTCSWKPGHCPTPAGACPEAGQAWQAPLFGVWEDLPPRGMPGLGNPGTSQVCASPRPLMSDSKGPPGTWLLWGIHRGLDPRIAPLRPGPPPPFPLLPSVHSGTVFRGSSSL